MPDTVTRPVWLRAAFYVLVVLAAYGYGLATRALIDEDPRPRVELVCHPIEGAADGARACVTP